MMQVEGVNTLFSNRQSPKSLRDKKVGGDPSCHGDSLKSGHVGIHMTSLGVAGDEAGYLNWVPDIIHNEAGDAKLSSCPSGH
jgi:hypothetical protein